MSELTDEQKLDAFAINFKEVLKTVISEFESTTSFQSILVISSFMCKFIK